MTPAASFAQRTGAIIAALPDGITAVAFAIVWVSPFAFGALSVKTALLTMLLEFFLIHATGFFTAFATGTRGSRWLRVALVPGLSVFYLLMVGAVALGFDEWWPLAAFGWLAVGKVVWSLRQPRGVDPDPTQRQMGAWAASVLAYLGGCFLTVLVPLPRLGMTAELQPRFGLTGGGLWVDEPHRVVVFGLVYFGALFVGKFWLAQRPAAAAQAR